MPLLAVSPRYFDSLYSTYHRAVMRFDAAARRLVPWQHLTFLPLLCVAKFGESRAQHLQADRSPNTYFIEQAAAGPTLPKCIQICKPGTVRLHRPPSHCADPQDRFWTAMNLQPCDLSYRPVSAVCQAAGTWPGVHQPRRRVDGNGGIRQLAGCAAWRCCPDGAPAWRSCCWRTPGLWCCTCRSAWCAHNLVLCLILNNGSSDMQAPCACARVPHACSVFVLPARPHTPGVLSCLMARCGAVRWRPDAVRCHPSDRATFRARPLRACRRAAG